MTSNRTYDVAKQFAQLVLPALQAFYLAISTIWGLDYTEQVVATIAAVNVLLGALVTFASKVYNNSDAKYDGSIDIVDNGVSTPVAAFDIGVSPEELTKRKDVTFKVTHEEIKPPSASPSE